VNCLFLKVQSGTGKNSIIKYQEKIYKDQVRMFNTIPHLAGVCPWLLFDYKSPGRLHPVYQKGYNRKGLLSEKGNKKKAWYVVKSFYDKN